MSAPQVLADTLAALTPPEYIRFVADWLGEADALEARPHLTGVRVVDALVAAAAAHAAFTSGRPIPGWTTEAARRCDPLWYPGPDALLPNALVHSPLSFVVRGVLVEAASLVSV
jgi:hypothetical protein